jgi:hypothetical protein
LNCRHRLGIHGEPGSLRQTLKSDRSHREDHFLSSNLYLPMHHLGVMHPFAAYHSGTCTQPVDFESVHVYVYNVEPSDDVFSLPPTLCLCR